MPLSYATYGSSSAPILPCNAVWQCHQANSNTQSAWPYFLAAFNRGGSRIFERGGLIIKKLYSKSVHGALIKYHFGSSRNDASLCAHKLIQV